MKNNATFIYSYLIDSSRIVYHSVTFKPMSNIVVIFIVTNSPCPTSFLNNKCIKFLWKIMIQICFIS